MKKEKERGKKGKRKSEGKVKNKNLFLHHNTLTINNREALKEKLNTLYLQGERESKYEEKNRRDSATSKVRQAKCDKQSATSKVRQAKCDKQSAK